MKKILFSSFFLLSICFVNLASANTVKLNEIKIYGNERISSQTILMFSNIKIGDQIDNQSTNKILKDLIKTDYFENVKVNLKKQTLEIYVTENPIINSIIIKGVKAKKIKKIILDSIELKSRNSFNSFKIQNDKENILEALKNLGYYFSKIDVFKDDLGDNRVEIIYDIDLGNKSKIKKISFVGNKIFKDNQLRNLIITEEYKFWKFITGRKYLDQNTIEIDKRLLKNFYLNKGFYNVEINSTFAKLVDDNKFELIFNIDANEKFYFGDINLNLPNDFDETNYKKIQKSFNKIKGENYSLNTISKILSELDTITTNEEFFSINTTVEEKFEGNKINLIFNIKEIEKTFVKKINIFGNNVTRENVIRNQLEIDEGDPFNEILAQKSINNIKNLNFFKKVNSEILQGKDKSKIININVEEKATGEITAGAGVGTTGGTVAFGIKENNYLGKGIKIDANTLVDSESFKGKISVINPNYKNSNNLINFSLQADETDRLKNFGYKTDKIGFSVGTKFEYLNDLNLGLNTSTFYETIETNSNASSKQKKQAGNYWDTFLLLDFDYDKRNQKFKTSDGFRSMYSINLPIISDTDTLTNIFKYKYFEELYENNISTFSFSLKAANSISNNNVKLSERLFVSSRELRGFERGKIGPKDGDDFIGGNFTSSINFSSTVPKILSNSENLDFLMFMDAANVWGVDYDSSISENSKIRSSLGIGVDWYTLIGPINFSFAHPISKHDNDKTETFRFNLGTTF